jgi:crotonobetainyl-CoA:carnitine CoA-transferase CaiB-like acyl-CoA transferase
MSGDEASLRPLAGLSVLQETAPGSSFLGRLLADLGASVTRVEGPRLQGGSDVSAFWEIVDRDKPVRASFETSDLDQFDAMLTDSPWTLLGECGESPWSSCFPRTILVSITPFGAFGPQAQRKSSDLVNLALGGYLYMTGPDGGTPLKPSVPFLSWRFAAEHALLGLMLARRRQRLTGCSSHVDVAARDTALWMLTHTYQYWDMERINLRRKGADRDVGRAGVRIPSIYQCRDGTIVWMLLSGQLGKGSVDRLVDWMASEGAAPDWLREADWQTLHLDAIPDINAFMKPFADFFMTKTRRELLDRAVVDGFMIAPAQKFADVLDDPQLEARGAWREVRFEDGIRRVPGLPVRLT